MVVNGGKHHKQKLTTNELAIKEATNTTRPDSYLNKHLEVDSEDQLTTKLYDEFSILATFQQQMHMENISLVTSLTENTY